MERKTVFATIVAAAFAIPFAATAGGTDKHTGAKTTTSSANGANDGGAQAMFTSMDKDTDGFISREEAANSPQLAQFATLDTNADGKLSAEEHASAKGSAAGRSASQSDATLATSPTTTTSGMKTQ